MPSLIDIRRRIRSVKNTQQITKAMKMVSTARLRRAQERVINARPFSRMAGEILRSVAAAASGAESVREHPLLQPREENNVQLVIVSADRGLAGGFNTNLIKAAQQFIAERPDQKIELELLGRKARDFFTRRPVQVSGELTGVSLTAGLPEATALAEKLTSRITAGETDAVYILYNEFKSILTQKITIRRVLPVEVQAGPQRDYIFEQPPAEMLARLLPKYVLLQVLEAFLESAAAEHAARMTAMDAATTNANDVINKLTLYMNRVRQASITREIIEVVSGASALE
ncbi:MAG: ATP synthase F1 subunit gamma [Candidatus Solibacter usitatus]|nr:ATP synthase F1 subunit gamma [Candidatus Solibacter usitatus]